MARIGDEKPQTLIAISGKTLKTTCLGFHVLLLRGASGHKTCTRTLFENEMGSLQPVNDQYYLLRKSSDSLRKKEMERVRHQMRGRNATYTVKRIILPLT